MVDFELIKGRIQKHKLSSIIHTTLEILNAVQRNDDKAFPIWSLLALIKWAYLFTTDSIIRSNIKPYEYNQLLTLIRDFEGKYNGLSFKSHQEINRSFKIIAYQQFALQDTFHNTMLSRQMVLYLQLNRKFDIAIEFKRLTHIELKSFLEYMYFTYFFFHFDKLSPLGIIYSGNLFESYFILFKAKWGDTELKKFLDLITLKNREDFEKLHKLNKEILQLYETDFFTIKPLILFRNEYRLLHRSIFVQTIKHFIYNYLKQNSEQFPGEFGKRLEKYIALGLDENAILYLDETALKKYYQLGKVADYLVEDNILIEVKAVELHPRSGVTRTRNILIKDLESSVIGAYIQLLATANKINATNEYFGIILTYKEMYLGFGIDAWDEFLKDPVEQYCNENKINLSTLPPQNLFFITIEDWDWLMEAVKSKHASIKKVLLKAKEVHASDNIAEKVMLMQQVLIKYFSVDECTLKYLKDTHLQLDIFPLMGKF